MEETPLEKILSNPDFVRRMRSLNLLLSTRCYELLLQLEEPMDARSVCKHLGYLRELESAGLVRVKDGLYVRTPLGDAFALAEFLKITACLKTAGIGGKGERASRVMMLSRLWRAASRRKDRLDNLSERIEGQARVLSRELDKLLRAIP